MEDNNMAREELNAQDLDDVVGGAFYYQYNSKGQYVVKVDNVGFFYAKENAKRQINLYNAQHPGTSDAELTAWALSQGLFWNI